MSAWRFTLAFITCIFFHFLRLDLSYLLFLCCASPFFVSFPRPLPILSRFCMVFPIDFCRLLYFILLIPYLEFPIFCQTSFLVPHTLPLLSYLLFLGPGFTCLALSIINDLNFHFSPRICFPNRQFCKILFSCSANLGEGKVSY